MTAPQPPRRCTRCGKRLAPREAQWTEGHGILCNTCRRKVGAT